VAPGIREHLDVEKQELFRNSISADDVPKWCNIVELQAAMLGRARRAIDCWGIVGRRLGLVKDVRVMIAKMVWDEPWWWSAKQGGAYD
jgi:hypothetical protein